MTDFNPLLAEQQCPGLAYAIAIEWPGSLYRFVHHQYEFEWPLENELSAASPKEMLDILSRLQGWLCYYCHICGRYNYFDNAPWTECEHSELVCNRRMFSPAHDALTVEKQCPGLAYALSIEWPEALSDFVVCAANIRKYRYEVANLDAWENHALAACIQRWGEEMRVFALASGHCRCGRWCKPLGDVGDE